MLPFILINRFFKAICKSRNGESGNGMSGMMELGESGWERGESGWKCGELG